jgi:peroxiredoxin family protein
MAVPPGVIGDGMVRVSVITAFTGTLTAVAATAGADITCFFTSDGFNRALNQAAVTDDRLCSTQSGEDPGRYNETLDVTYIWDAQNTVPANNLAYTTLVPSVQKFLVVRYALPYTSAYAAAQKVDVIAVTPGIRQRMAVAANEKLKTGQKLFIPADGVTYDLALT